MRRAVLSLLATVALTGSVAAQAPGVADQQRRLMTAKRAAAEAGARAARLTREADRERDAAARARTQEAALAERVRAAEADLAAATARVAIVETLLARQRATLGAAQAPVARLLAALQSLASRPAVASIAQPGSIDDLVHIRAVLGAALPVIRARTEGVRAELAETRRLQANARMASAARRSGRGRLEDERVALARLEAAHRRRATALGRHAISESDRALALGEEARDLIDRMSEQDAAAVTTTDLAGLPDPKPRPLSPGARPPVLVRGAYRLPVSGRLETGLDEISQAGVRSRGLSFLVGAGARVVAPAGGVVRYARRFRGYGVIVIVDHGDGWSSLLTGLADTGVKPGETVAGGVLLGHAGRGGEPVVTVELRRRGRPADIAALVG